MHTRRMRRFNLHDAPAEFDEADPEGYRAGMRRVGKEIGARLIGGTIYELPPGQSACAYHYEYGNEEWAVVLAGRPTLRHPGGEEELAPGDAVCFPPGPGGAHKLTNRSEEPARVLMLSTQHDPAVVVYPDSDKIGIWPGEPGDNLLVRRESRVDYWDRET
jgi:uncharacterized cupin superfamily protein